jgi:hypothetical protein
MKRNNLTKKSLMTSMIIGLTALFHAKASGVRIAPSSHTDGGMFWNPQAIYIPRHRKFKGYDRENRKCTFNKNK